MEKTVFGWGLVVDTQEKKVGKKRYNYARMVFLSHSDTLQEIRVLIAVRYSVFTLFAIVEFRETIHSVLRKRNAMVDWAPNYFALALSFSFDDSMDHAENVIVGLTGKLKIIWLLNFY